jgi:hypothetical protein
MTILSAAIFTKNGRVLLARQFVDISQARIEGLLGAFPKLRDTVPKSITHIETDTVRYVYMGVEEFYLVLITTKAANIVANLDTLQLLSKLIPEYAGGINELAINRNKFELIFAFDEVVTGGCTSPQDVRTCTDMDSHEERVQQMVTKSKEKEARLIALKKQKEIEEMKRSGDYPLPHPLPAAKGIMIPPPKPPKPPARATLKPMVLARPVVTMPKDILDEW